MNATSGPVETLARLAIQSYRYAADKQFRSAVDAVIGKPVFNAAPDLLKSQIAAYYVLADFANQWPTRHTKEGQHLLCDMRDSIASALDMDAELVQAGGAA